MKFVKQFQNHVFPCCLLISQYVTSLPPKKKECPIRFGPNQIYPVDCTVCLAHVKNKRLHNYLKSTSTIKGFLESKKFYFCFQKRKKFYFCLPFINKYFFLLLTFF